jgi:2-polyprenyl-3-methyl-5-hydroxy-6-metoxy-1,4-benzoquinol methylase
LYQDVWVKGRRIIKGERDCEGRYAAIRHELRRLGFPGKNGDRSFTVLDIGAASGYFSFRLAEEFNARVTMIESSPAIVKWWKKNDNPNVALIRRAVTARELLEMAKRERYDVVLALSVLHHFPDFERAVLAMFRLGRVVFIEPPAQEEAEGGYQGHRATAILQLLVNRPHRVLTHTPNLRGLGKRPLMVFGADAGHGRGAKPPDNAPTP